MQFMEQQERNIEAEEDQEKKEDVNDNSNNRQNY